MGSTLGAEGFVQHQSTFQHAPQSRASPRGSAHSSSRSPLDTGTPGAVTAHMEAADAECQGVVWPHGVTLGRAGPLWASFPTSLGTGLGSQGPPTHLHFCDPVKPHSARTHYVPASQDACWSQPYLWARLQSLFSVFLYSVSDLILNFQSLHATVKPLKSNM